MSATPDIHETEDRSLSALVTLGLASDWLLESFQRWHTTPFPGANCFRPIRINPYDPIDSIVNEFKGLAPELRAPFKAGVVSAVQQWTPEYELGVLHDVAWVAKDVEAVAAVLAIRDHLLRGSLQRLPGEESMRTVLKLISVVGGFNSSSEHALVIRELFRELQDDPRYVCDIVLALAHHDPNSFPAALPAILRFQKSYDATLRSTFTRDVLWEFVREVTPERALTNLWRARPAIINQFIYVVTIDQIARWLQECTDNARESFLARALTVNRLLRVLDDPLAVTDETRHILAGAAIDRGLVREFESDPNHELTLVDAHRVQIRRTYRDQRILDVLWNAVEWFRRAAVLAGSN